jgi:hypothetical protein
MRARLDGFQGFVLGLALASVALFPLVPLPANAHNSGYWFNPVTWDVIGDIDVRIDDSIPGAAESNFEDRIHDGRKRWNGQCCIGSFIFIDAGNGSRAYGPPCDWAETTVDVWVFYASIGAAGGLASECVIYHPQQDQNYIHSGRLIFDSTGVTWHTGDSDPPAGELWVEEVATHEFGHLTGTFIGGNPAEGNTGGHWVPEPSPMCAAGGAESDWTMCPLGTLGHSYLVPLETHDIDTFQDLY